MKKLQLILNIFFATAIVILFALYFCKTNRCSTKSSSVAADIKTPSGPLSIAFVNVDSLISNYDLFHDMKKKLEKKQNDLENQLQQKSVSLQKEVQDYQVKAQKGLMTRSEMQDTENRLREKEQNLMQLKEELSMQLAEEEQVMQRKLTSEIHDYLQEFNKDKTFTYILGMQFGGNLLYANDSMNITKGVTTGLNEKFKANSEKK